ncbi:MAG: hypothetical protein L6V78_04770 [Clostridium sp.]|nr:MAG: hypothetical protein L6V78_04770 [Clostridium sp.]
MVRFIQDNVVIMFVLRITIEKKNKGLTRLYQEKGQQDFEKFFITNLLLEGTVEVLNGSNNTLRRLNYIANLLWKDKEFIKLRNKRR